MKRLQTLIIAMACVINLLAQNAFPLPQIPETMRQPEERLTYLVNHFWDNYQFNDTTQVNQDLGEQGFADFINVLGYGNDELIENATKIFYDLAFTTSWGKNHYSQMINHYLDNPNSPLRNVKLRLCMPLSLLGKRKLMSRPQKLTACVASSP